MSQNLYLALIPSTSSLKQHLWRSYNLKCSDNKEDTIKSSGYKLSGRILIAILGGKDLFRRLWYPLIICKTTEYIYMCIVLHKLQVSTHLLLPVHLTSEIQSADRNSALFALIYIYLFVFQYQYLMLILYI